MHFTSAECLAINSVFDFEPETAGYHLWSHLGVFCLFFKSSHSYGITRWYLPPDTPSNPNPIQYEHAPLRVRCAMLRKHPPVDPVLSCLSCFQKPSVAVCQVIGNSPDPGIAWPSAGFRPDLWRWFEEDTASIRRLVHSGYMWPNRERRRVLTIEESGGCWVAWRTSSLFTKSDHLKPTKMIGSEYWQQKPIIKIKLIIKKRQ